MLGIFVSAIPTVFSLKTRAKDFNSSTTENDSDRGSVATPNLQGGTQPLFLWPTLMILAQIPVAVNYVLYETSKCSQ